MEIFNSADEYANGTQFVGFIDKPNGTLYSFTVFVLKDSWRSVGNIDNRESVHAICHQIQ